MRQRNTGPDTDVRLHAAEVALLERRILDLALERTGGSSGAIFVWDRRDNALAVDFHVVNGVIVNIPGARLRRRRDGRPNGIALWVLDHNEPYLCADTSKDPNYARYFHDVGSIAAAPISYQGRAIGVITVSAQERNALTEEHLAELSALAASSAKFLRRAQLDRTRRRDQGRPFLLKGLSAAWLEVEQQIEGVSATDAPVLVWGESGTGKELVANAIHFNSPRVDRPFVTVNCAAIPDTLLESILFGHVRGAFTGATFRKVGEFQKAHRGTLFLDEVGELPMPLQAKVLRAVEQGEVQPLGSNDPPERIDVRLICATNRDLGERVRQGRFRDDLFFRLSVVIVELPPLRSYKDNLEVMAQAFLQQAALRHGKPAQRLSPASLSLLLAYDFPGNVRELKNAIEHAVIMAPGEEVRPQDLPRSLRRAAPTSPPSGAADVLSAPATLEELREAWLAPLERRYLAELLVQSGGRVREAAVRAGVNVVTMYRLLERRGLKGRRAPPTALPAPPHGAPRTSPGV